MWRTELQLCWGFLSHKDISATPHNRRFLLPIYVRFWGFLARCHIQRPWRHSTAHPFPAISRSWDGHLVGPFLQFRTADSLARPSLCNFSLCRQDVLFTFSLDCFCGLLQTRFFHWEYQTAYKSWWIPSATNWPWVPGLGGPGRLLNPSNHAIWPTALACTGLSNVIGDLLVSSNSHKWEKNSSVWGCVLVCIYKMVTNQHTRLLINSEQPQKNRPKPLTGRGLSLTSQNPRLLTTNNLPSESWRAAPAWAAWVQTFFNDTSQSVSKFSLTLNFRSEDLPGWPQEVCLWIHFKRTKNI